MYLQTYLFNNNPVEIFEQDNIEILNYAYRKFVVNPFTQISLKDSKILISISYLNYIIEQDVIDITKNHILVFDCLGSNFRSHEH